MFPGMVLALALLSLMVLSTDDSAMIGLLFILVVDYVVNLLFIIHAYGVYKSEELMVVVKLFLNFTMSPDDLNICQFKIQNF